MKFEFLERTFLSSGKSVYRNQKANARARDIYGGVTEPALDLLPARTAGEKRSKKIGSLSVSKNPVYMPWLVFVLS